MTQIQKAGSGLRQIAGMDRSLMLGMSVLLSLRGYCAFDLSNAPADRVNGTVRLRVSVGHRFVSRFHAPRKEGSAQVECLRPDGGFT